MSHELLYTSAPRGLKPGSRGFCTVVSSQGMPAPLASALESLSSYRHVYRPGDPQAGDNPVVWSHVRLSAAGRQYSVLSRISDYRLDYSDRSNKLAHHVALEAREQTEGGPAWNLRQSGFMESSWDGTPRVIPTARPAVPGCWEPAVCTAWQTLTGDAGWAGVLAESFLANPDRHVYVEFSTGMDLLPLLVEAIGLLPPERRWEATFSTFFTNLPPGVVCNWRCVLAGSPEAIQAKRSVRALRINLCEPLPAAVGGALVELARTGQMTGALSHATHRPADGAPQNSSLDDRADELAPGTNEEAAPISSPDASGTEFDDNAPMPPEETYDVENRIPQPPGMPPPPPPSAGFKRRRLEALHAEDARRRWRWLIGGAVALALMLAGVGIGKWMRSGTGPSSPKAVASADRAADGAESGGGDDESDSNDMEDKLPGNGRLDPNAPDASTPAREKEDSDGDSAIADSNGEVPPLQPATNVGRDNASDESPDTPRPAGDEPAPMFDGRPLVPDRGPNGKQKLYYLDAATDKTMVVPVQSENVVWDLHAPTGLPEFEVDRSDPSTKVLLKKGPAASNREPAFTVTGERQADRLLLTLTGGNTDRDAIKWCLLSVRDEGARPLLFALQSGQLGWDAAQFKSGSCRKTLPHAADGIKLPSIQTESVVVRLAEFDRSFGFEVPPAAQRPQANASLRSPQIEDFFTRDFLQVPAIVSLETKQESAGITLTIKGLAALDSALKKRVDSQIKELNRQWGVGFPKLKATRIDDEWKRGSARHLAEIEAALDKRITDLAGTTQDAANSAPAAGPLEAAQATIAGLRISAEQFFKFKKSLQDAQITEASFYYEVAAPGRNQPTKVRLRFSKAVE